MISFLRPHILYYLHPDVSFTKVIMCAFSVFTGSCILFTRQGGGEPQIGNYLDMPDNTASGDLWNPPDTESTMGISYDGCEAARAVPVVMQVGLKKPGKSPLS